MTLVQRAYRNLANAYINNVDPKHKRSRELYNGEYHIPLHNFTGPGTRMDLKEVRDFKPYNDIDACSKQHDIDYINIKRAYEHGNLNKEQKSSAIMDADRRAIECYNKYKNEYGYTAAKLGIKGKLTVETLISMLKGKPTTLYGGLLPLGLDRKALLAERDPKYYTDDEKRIIKMLTLSTGNNVVTPLGSFTYAIQKYPSDIDLSQMISVSNISTFIKDLRRTVKKIDSTEDTYFTDFKAGNKKWTQNDIMDDKKKGALEDALLDPSGKKDGNVIKLDMVIVGTERIIEASTFFILVSESTGAGKQYINMPQNFLELFVEAIKGDIRKYSTPPNVKLFKVIKRMWSLARLEKDIPMLKKLAPAIDSNLSVLGQINADLESIILLIEKYGDSIIKLPNIQNILNGFEKKLSNISDIDIDLDMLNKSIEKLKILSKDGLGGKAEAIMGKVHGYILDVLNRESRNFLGKV